jgi:hypothetical protein
MHLLVFVLPALLLCSIALLLFRCGLPHRRRWADVRGPRLRRRLIVAAAIRAIFIVRFVVAGIVACSRICGRRSFRSALPARRRPVTLPTWTARRTAF